MPQIFISEEDNRTVFKQAIIDFLCGKNGANQTEHDIKLACTYRDVKIDAKTFCENISLFPNKSNRNLDPQIIQILEHLKLSTTKTDYKHVGSLYQLLILNETEESEYLISLINASRPTPLLIDYIWWPMLSSIAGLGFCYLQPHYFWSSIDWLIDIIPTLYHWLHYYVVQLHNLPLLGMGGQIILLALYLRYDTFENGIEPSAKKMRSLMFRALSLFLNFIAHWISYTVAGALPLLPAIIFAISSFVELVPTLATYFSKKSRSKPAKYSDPFDIRRAHDEAFEERKNYTFERNRHIILIQGLVAIVFSALVLTVSALPSNVILSMAYMLSMWLAFLIKDYYITTIKHKSANAQQLAIYGIYASYTKEAKNEFSTHADALLKDIKDPQKHTKCCEEKTRLLENKNFDIKNAKELLEHFIESYDRISPFKISQDNSLFTTPSRRNSYEAGANDSLIHPHSARKK